ncbi:kinase [Metasolibacillus meyeri]|uniref:kinase n=1 Tax=Metasolibacillus meyeri TaxID=1071052 RepID=UPI000D320A84|nr:kinase [Metasolibacillus meyeri]
MHDTVKQEIKEAYKDHDLDRPFIVAIDGLSGVGKTTFVQQLKNEADMVIIHIDNHIVERKLRYHTKHAEWYEYYHLQWDITYLTENLFEKLHNNAKQLCLAFYSHEEDRSINKTIHIPSRCIVIIEGVFLLREEWKAFYDYIIFLDCPKEIRYERAVQRDKYLGSLEQRISKYKNRYWPAEEYYLQKQAPLKFAHSIKSEKPIDDRL